MLRTRMLHATCLARSIPPTPLGWEEDPDTVYEVRKPLYGLPHSGRCLHKTWSQWLNSEGFESVGYDKSMWVKKEGSENE